MPGRTINVAVSHSLLLDTAKARLKAMVNSPRTDPRFKTGSFAWDQATNTFTVEIIAYGQTIKAKAALTPGLVTVTTEPINGFGPIVAFGVWRAETEIKAMLEEALKP